MEFRTKIDLVPSGLQIDHQTRLMLFGSCFAQNIGELLQENKFDLNINPFGILYNPASVSKVLRRICDQEYFDKKDIFLHDGLYHSFLHHGSFSRSDEKEMIGNLNRLLEKSSDDLKQTNLLIITFGTSYVYKEKQNDEVVANCHKLPAADFHRYRLTVEEIVNDWSGLIGKLRENNPAMKFLLTVSPIRHWKDGAHDNQLSKATLLLAIDELQRKYDNIFYFPSYELMLDDLRDYRFYAEDMLHPNQVAIKYIWEHFAATFFNNETEAINKEWNSLRMALDHRPFNPHTEEHKQFLRQTLLRLEKFQNKYPYFRLGKEKRILEDQLK